MRLAAIILLVISFDAAATGEKFNIRTAPVSDLIGIYNAELDYKISDSFTVGPTLHSFNYTRDNTKYSNLLLGGRVNYYFGTALEGGWLASLSAGYGSFDVSRESGGLVYSTSSAMRIYTALFSYQAMWDSFNLTFGVGGSYFAFPETVSGINGVDVLTISTSFLSGFLPNAELSVGWRF